MSDLICKNTMTRCQTPGACSPHGGCRVIALECRAEVAHDTLTVIRAVLKTAEAEIDELKAANEILRKDAERHQWLRIHEFDIGSYHGVHEHNAAAWFESISDEAIDAAIADELAFETESKS